MRSIFNRCDANSNTTSERAERGDFLASCATEGEAEGERERQREAANSEGVIIIISCIA